MAMTVRQRVVRTVESGRHSRREVLPRRGGRRWGPFRDRRGPAARRQAAERETQTTGEEEAETAYGVDTGRGYEDLVQSLREAAESEDCEGVGALVPEVERTLDDLFARVKAKEGERSESAAATTSSSPDLLAQGDDGSVTDEEKIADLLAQVTEFDRADGESEVDSLKRMRRRVDALQRELVRQELKVVMRDVESNLEREERELDEFLGMEFGMEAQKLNYISVTFLTLGVASVAWACEQFLLGEDTSWWWSLPGGLSGARDWLLMVCPPVVIAGLTQLPALKPLVAKFDYLDEYLTQTFTYNADYLRLDEVDVAGPLPGDLDVSDYEEAGQGPLDPSSVPFATYLCFDTVIIGSELIVALGFLEGLLLKGAGAYGWASQDEFAADTAAANALGGLVDTLPLNQFLIGPLVVLAVSALITSIDFQLNEIEKEEDALLSDLLYSPEAKTSELAQDADLKAVVKYLKRLRMEKVGEEMREKEALKQKFVGGEPPASFQADVPRAPRGKRMAEEVGSKLVAWQEKLLARRKYVWIEAAYWLYLTGEVWCSHSLVPSILTALTIETFSWYSLYKSQHFEEEEVS